MSGFSSWLIETDSFDALNIFNLVEYLEQRWSKCIRWTQVYARLRVGWPNFIYAMQISIFLNCSALHTCTWLIWWFTSTGTWTTFKAVCDILMNFARQRPRVMNREKASKCFHIWIYFLTSMQRWWHAMSLPNVLFCPLLGMGWCGGRDLRSQTAPQDWIRCVSESSETGC